MGLFARIAAYFAPAPSNDVAPRTLAGSPAKRRRRRTAPLSKSKTRWYLADLEMALRAADTGDMGPAARLYAGLRRDGTVHGLLATRTGGLVRMRRKFRGDPEVVAALEGARDGRQLFDEIFPPSELALLAADGIILGIGVGEMICVETLDATGAVVATRKELRRLNPEFLLYRWDEDCWYYHSTEGLLRIEPGNGRWILHCPGGKQEPWTHGLWASLGRAYIAKDHAFMHRENYAAKLANPARVAVAPQGAAEPQKQNWWRAVMAWGVNTVFGVTPGYDVKLLESNGRGYEVFQAVIDSADREYMVGIVGQIVTVTGGAGFANADVHATVRADLIEETGDGLAYTLNTQALPCWANVKFGAERRAFVGYDTTPAKNLKAEAESMSAAATAIEDLQRALTPHGIAPDVATIASKLGVPVSGDLDGDAMPDPAAAVTSEEPLEDTAVEALAAKMTQYKVPRCEHGRVNRCPQCGIERVRDFAPGPDGVPQWSIAWRKIGAPAPAAPTQEAA